MKLWLSFVALGLICAAAAAAQAPAPTLEQVLSKMDEAARNFQTIAADITYTKVTVIVNDKSVEKGQVLFKRNRGKRNDFKIRINFREPAERIVLLSGNKGSIYRPKIAQVEEYDLGEHKEAIDQFLLLGFGTPGHDIANAYNMVVAGTEKVGNQDTVKLDLTPKSAGVARSIKKVELWISRETWQPVQQKFTEPSDDYLITEYTSPKLNAPIPDSEFDLKLPRNVKRVRPQAG